MTQLESIKNLVRRYYEDVVSTGRVELVEDFLAPDYVELFDGKRFPIGIEGGKAHIQGVRQTYPDLTIEIEKQIAEGEWVATCMTARGTHLGVWLGMKPTGRRLVFTGVNLDRVVEGRIVEHGGAANMLGPLLEAGAIRVVGPDE